MRQILCDRCGEPITDVSVAYESDREMFRVGLRLGWGTPVSDTDWFEFHRKCARTMTLAEVYERPGWNPL